MYPKIYLFSISSHPKTTNVNALSITLLQPNIDFSKYDYFILTSKQASKALSQYEKKSYIDKKALCISKATALSYEKLGGEVLNMGSGYGDTLYDIICSYSKNIKWLYLRASIVASDFVKRCQNDGYNIDEAIVYESQCSDEIMKIKIESHDTLIFTSPSSVKCFLKNSTIASSNKIVVIGKSTAKALPQGVEYTLAPDTTIESCIKVLKL